MRQFLTTNFAFCPACGENRRKRRGKCGTQDSAGTSGKDRTEGHEGDSHQGQRTGMNGRSGTPCKRSRVYQRTRTSRRDSRLSGNLVDVTQINSPRSIDLQERGAQDERSERNQTATHPTAYIDTQKSNTVHHIYVYTTPQRRGERQ